MSDRITFEIPTADLQKAVKTLALWTDKKRADVRKSIGRGVLKIESAAKKKTPVDTGRLRSSITGSVDADGLGGEVATTNVKYAAFVEYGTGRRGATASAFIDEEDEPVTWEYGPSAGMPAQPYLRPALREEIPSVVEEISLALKQL